MSLEYFLSSYNRKQKSFPFLPLISPTNKDLTAMDTDVNIIEPKNSTTVMVHGGKSRKE